MFELLTASLLQSMRLTDYPASTGIVELNFLKHGYPRSKNTAAGKWYNSGLLREGLLNRAMEQWED